MLFYLNLASNLYIALMSSSQCWCVPRGSRVFFYCEYFFFCVGTFNFFRVDSSQGLPVGIPNWNLSVLFRQRYYIASSRQIRRLAGASQSPVISHFSETLAGRSTIRAFGHQERFIRKNNAVVYENLVCFYNNLISNRYLTAGLHL